VTTTAASTRHLLTLWHGQKPWHWAALKYGHAQPLGFRNHLRARRFWQIHLTPVHIERDYSKWNVGICWGKRTVYLMVHR
jgi:hypothetical protein